MIDFSQMSDEELVELNLKLHDEQHVIRAQRLEINQEQTARAKRNIKKVRISEKGFLGRERSRLIVVPMNTNTDTLTLEDIESEEEVPNT
jgi:hypothetical protein